MKSSSPLKRNLLAFACVAFLGAPALAQDVKLMDGVTPRPGDAATTAPGAFKKNAPWKIGMSHFGLKANTWTTQRAYEAEGAAAKDKRIASFVVLLGGVGGSGLWGMFRIESSGSSFIEGPFADAVNLQSLYRYLGDARREEKSMIIPFNQDIAGHKAQWTAALAQADQHLKALQASARDEKTAEVLASVDKHLASYKKNFEGKVNNFNFFSDAGAVEQDIAFAQQSALEVQKAMELLQQRLRDDSDHAQQVIKASAQGTLVIFCGILGTSLLLIAGFTIVSLRSIVKPLETAKQIASSIATGDLEVAMTASGRDECADMIRALEDMQASLRKTVLGVRGSAESTRMPAARWPWARRI